MLAINYYQKVLLILNKFMIEIIIGVIFLLLILIFLKVFKKKKKQKEDNYPLW